MTTLVTLLDYLKRRGSSTISELKTALGLSENAVRHHLGQLERRGLISAEPTPTGAAGRPPRRYRLTQAAEGLFPKRYQELLELVLDEAEARGLLGTLLEGVAQRIATQLAATLPQRSSTDRLQQLLEGLDYGQMLASLERTATGWELRAFNCLYRDIGCRFEGVCNLLPRAITLATGLAATRLSCQRDGERACRFAIAAG